MSSKLLKSFKDVWNIDRHERMKLLYLSGAFFLVIAAYTIMKDIKDTVFVHLVGLEYMPEVKLFSMFILVPAILLFAYLVDRYRRYQLIYIYTIFYGIAGLLFAYLLGQPEIGLLNSTPRVTNWVGWAFYFFIEGYSPFIVSLMWAFMNSVSSPESAKKTYPLVVAASKVGGMMTAGFAWYFFSCEMNFSYILTGAEKHQYMVAGSSLILLLVPLTIYWMMRTVPGYYLHGYEAVYKEEKAKKKNHEEKTGLFAGLWLLFRLPYVMGIFGMIFFYEAIYTALNFQRMGILQKITHDVSGFSCASFEQMFYIHLTGFLISLFGTTALLRIFGERKCLLFIPLATGFFIALLFLFGSTTGGMLTLAIVGVRAINYGINYPVRESLYVPTMKEVKFKSKSWIDSFGSKFSKNFGGSYNKLSLWLAHGSGSGLFALDGIYFGVLIVIWVAVAHLLGKRFDRVVENNETIGMPE